jgi:carbamoyltransferase
MAGKSRLRSYSRKSPILRRATILHTPKPVCARARLEHEEKLRRGEAIYLCGIGPGGHNSGIALVEVTAERGVRLLVNNEQERFSGIKHDTNYPDLAIDSLLDQMRDMDIMPSKIHACLASWDYVRLPATFTRTCFEELPWSLTYFNPAANPAILNIGHVWRSYGAPRRLGSQMNLDRAFPIVGMRHHDNHAWFSYAMSPFAGSSDPVMVAVLDGLGDDGSISLYSAKNGKIDMLRSNKSTFDSPGVFYGMVSSTQGGWTLLSSEGRYMGAAAWGQADRLTNPFYRQLRELFHFGNDGQVYLNRALANWHRGLQLRPYTRALSKIIGKPIPEIKMWNPDAVLRPDDIRHAEITQERLDKAAATQLVFEDVMFHVIAYLIRTTGSHKLVLTGGTALNAVANMRLLDHFNEEFYERYLAMKQTRLHLWVPPTPGDAGVTAGAAYNFALANGAPLGRTHEACVLLRSNADKPLYCRRAPEHVGNRVDVARRRISAASVRGCS